jgi:hypothetical protein
MARDGRHRRTEYLAVAHRGGEARIQRGLGIAMAILCAATGVGCAPAASSPPSARTSGPTESLGVPAPTASLGTDALPTPGILPSGSPPLFQSIVWRGMGFSQLTSPAAPLDLWTVTGWMGGYLALGPVGTGEPLDAWLSRDGRAWVDLPIDLFGIADTAQAVPLGDRVLVVIRRPTGAADAYQSTDGIVWQRHPAPFGARALRSSNVAGGPNGAIAVVDGATATESSGLAFTADGATWALATLPGVGRNEVDAVAQIGDRFVAVGSRIVPTIAAASGGGLPEGAPAAWWSDDGANWQLADTAPAEGSFVEVQGGDGGLVALSHSGGTPGIASYWRSANGRSWAPSQADPIGIWEDGEGAGSAAGSFATDGHRLVVFGRRNASSAAEYWTSFDGVSWTKLILVAPPPAVLEDGLYVAVLRDGLFLASRSGAWIGTAAP